MKQLSELWRLLRPRQWVKNGFVFIGALFANAWRQPHITSRVILTVVAFSLTASSVYIINDLIDRKEDAKHPLKRHRPLAAETVSRGIAVSFSTVLFLVALVLGLLVSKTVLLILLAYLVMNLAYSLRLKHIVILDVFIIAAGFMLRIFAGTFGIGIAPSQWLLLCGLMMALFLGFAKRRAELYAAGPDGPTHRKALDNYQAVLLDKMIVVTATCMILTYSLYTMSPATIQLHHTESLIYTVPFVMYGTFRYIYSLHQRTAGSDPALQIFRDPHLLVAICGWLIVTLWLIT